MEPGASGRTFGCPRVNTDTPQQHSICHVLDTRLSTRHILKSNGITNLRPCSQGENKHTSSADASLVYASTRSGRR